jgi:uncharacterized Zn finger protein
LLFKIGGKVAEKERPKCPGCGKNKFTSEPHRSKNGVTLYRIVYCKNCGHIIGCITTLVSIGNNVDVFITNPE